MNFLKKQLDSIRHYSFPGTRVLEQELNSVREAQAVASAELATVRENQQQTHEDDVQLLAELRSQVKQVKSERGHAQYQIEVLERSLAHSEQRQKFTETHVESLERKLEEERERYEASMQATEARQTHLQAEQQSQLKQQAELANTFHRVSARLFESLQGRSGKQKYSLLQLMVFAGVLFVTGALIGVLSRQGLQDGTRELTVVKQDISDMRGFMQQHIDNQDALIKELSVALNSQVISEAAVDEELPAEAVAPLPALAEQPAETVTYTADIRELQTNLMTLGFDLGITEPNGELGIKTKQALQEFRQFYLLREPAEGGEISEPLAAMILKSADLVEADAARFNVGNDVLAAIRLGSIRTGLTFSFLMELARVESNFDPVARAPKSSATGLFQFRDNPWLEAIRMFGADYGLGDYASRVELINDAADEQQPIVRDPLQQEVLALRLNPRLSTLMIAEIIKRDLSELAQETGREPARTDLYLSHYLGLTGAIVFLKTLDENPAAIAAEMFPQEAARNPVVFQTRQHQPRSVGGVYQWLDRKFNTGRYDERDPG